MTADQGQPTGTRLKAPTKVIHVDMDAFFASVERLSRPDLIGKPIAVGGSPEGRGVVTSPSYEARAFGVRSAMPVKTALKLCPQLILVRGVFDKYRHYNAIITSILGTFTPKVQMISIDEGYLDISHHTVLGKDLALRLKLQIRSQTGLTASAGVAPNKMLAKIASDWNKPDGLTVIAPAQVEAFMAQLSVAKIPGVGPKTFAKLGESGIATCQDVLDRGEDYWQAQGRFGHWLWRRARGIDERPVAHEPAASKSIGCQTTLSQDSGELSVVKGKLAELCTKLEQRLKGRGGKTLTVTIRYEDFSQRSKSLTVGEVLHSGRQIYELATTLLEPLMAGAAATGLRRPLKVRKVGVSLAGIVTIAGQYIQPSLFADDDS